MGVVVGVATVNSLCFSRSHPAACVSQSAVLQLACAVVQALEGEGSGRWEEAAGREKVRCHSELCSLVPILWWEGVCLGMRLVNMKTSLPSYRLFQGPCLFWCLGPCLVTQFILI